jgi:selT/selW/selH-like putative selenoprotein
MNVVSFIHMITIAFFFLGDTLWNMLGFTTPPSWYSTCKQYPVQSLVGIFLIMPSFFQSFITTGAFEIMCNGEVLFSKLDSGRFPNGVDLVEVFKNFGLTQAAK